MSEINRNFAVVNAASVNKGRAYLIIFVATMSKGLFEMVIDYVEREIAEQLLAGYSVHFDGLGRFSLQLGTRKVKDEADRLLSELVAPPFPKYYRTRQGNMWVYRKTGT